MLLVPPIAASQNFRHDRVLSGSQDALGLDFTRQLDPPHLDAGVSLRGVLTKGLVVERLLRIIGTDQSGTGWLPLFKESLSGDLVRGRMEIEWQE